jgi:CBS domain-containing protein
MERRVVWPQVRQIMTAPAISVRPGTAVGALERLFDIHDFNGFPVADEQGRLRGFVTKFDLLRVYRARRFHWMPEIRPLPAERVDDLMTRSIVGVEPDDAVSTVVDRMLEYGVRSLPVVERRDGEPVLVGMVSRTDVLRFLTQEAPDFAGRTGSATESS